MYPTLTRRTQRRGKAQIKERGSSLAQEGVGPPERGRASIRGADPVTQASRLAHTWGGGHQGRWTGVPSGEPAHLLQVLEVSIIRR